LRFSLAENPFSGNFAKVTRLASCFAEIQLKSRARNAKGENAKLSDKEIELGADLIENMSEEFNPEKYRNEYRERVQAMLDEKSKGQEITVAAPEAPRHAQIIDLMQALKQSIEKAKPKQKAAPAQRKRKAAS
jgi:DNA end-binding protein Ku